MRCGSSRLRIWPRRGWARLAPRCWRCNFRTALIMPAAPATTSRFGVTRRTRSWWMRPLTFNVELVELATTTVLRTPSTLPALLKSLRLHQWIKNVIVFVPIILGGHLGDIEALLHTFVAFIALGLMASATYLINDIWDVADDRKHWSKRSRPIAAGHLPMATALIAAPLIILPAVALAAAVSPATLAFVLVYLAITLAYSFGLKRIPFVDGLVLAALFTVRLAIGATAAQVPPSAWLFVFSMFLFASLSYAKRHTEIARVIERQHATVMAEDIAR